jgi:diguanylate cyclase (GGDEF)-like protein
MFQLKNWFIGNIDLLLGKTEELFFANVKANVSAEAITEFKSSSQNIINSLNEHIGNSSETTGKTMKHLLSPVSSESAVLCSDPLFLLWVKSFRVTVLETLAAETENTVSLGRYLSKINSFFDCCELEMLILHSEAPVNFPAREKNYKNYSPLPGFPENLFHEILTALPDPLMLLDNNYNIRIMNFAAFNFIHSIVPNLSQLLNPDNVTPLADILPELHEHLTLIKENYEKERAFPLTLSGVSNSKHKIMVNCYRLRDDKGTYSAVLLILENLSGHKKIEAQLRYISFHDPLTKLFNRAYFEEEMKRLGSGRYDPVGVISCDIDGLKVVNDVLGHQAGDILLIAAGNIIRGCFRDSDVVARIGGDEFAVLLPVSDEEITRCAIERLERAQQDYNEKSPFSPVSISLGWSVRTDTQSSLSKAYKDADYMMYQFKPWSRDSFLKKFYELYKNAPGQMYLKENFKNIP